MKIKKVLGVILILSFSLVLSGCWETKCDDFRADLTARAKLNQKVVDDLVAAQLLKESTGETLKKSIGEAVEVADLEKFKGLLNGSENDKKLPKNSITWYLKEGDECWSPSPTLDGEFPYTNKGTDLGDGKLVTYSGSGADTLEPIAAVGVNQVDMINKELAYTVWVLKKPKDDNDNAVDSLDVTVELVNKIKNTTDSTEKESLLAQMEGMFYDTGETLLDPVKEPVIKETKLPSLTMHYYCDCDEEDNCPGAKREGPAVRNQELGYDMALTYKTIPVVFVRFLEFNQPVVEKLIGAFGADRDKYLVDPGGGRVFLLEYPVNYIESIEMDGDNKYKCNIAESDIRVNILSGKLYNKNNVELKQNKNKLIHIDGAGGLGDIGTSAFVKFGKSKVTNIGYSNKEVESGAIVLRDYLELMYTPDVVEGEDFIAPGRRIRIINFTGDIGTKAASFITMDGRVVERISSGGKDTNAVERIDDFGYSNPAHEIYVTDFVDLETCGKDDSKNKLKPAKINMTASTGGSTTQNNGNNTQTTNTNEQTTDPNEPTEDPNKQTGYITKDYSGGKILKTNYVSSIKPTCKFPSDKIATGDGKDLSTGQMIFYGLLTDKNPFETALYSNWINKDDETNGSLSWWNDWLKQNEFLYQIDKNDLEEEFMGNYQFDMAKEGFIVLNLDTISKIQRDLDESQRSRELSKLRGMFIILGFILMAYSMLLLAAWAFDCVIMTGFNLLTFITFGKWVAVRSTQDIPNIDVDGRYYLDFQKVLISCMVIMGVGFLLTLVDVIDIISGLIEAIGGISEMIDWVIFKN